MTFSFKRIVKSSQSIMWSSRVRTVVVVLWVFVFLNTCNDIHGEQRSDGNNSPKGRSNQSVGFQPSVDFPQVKGIPGQGQSGGYGFDLRLFNQHFPPHYNHQSAPAFGVNKFHNGFHGAHTLPAFYPGYGLSTTEHYRKQVRVHGIIKIEREGPDAIITCTFPGYLMLVQGIYWHYKNAAQDPYGSYYDTRNSFSPKIIVNNTNLWSSELRIKSFDASDSGHYRCISTAIVPEDPGVPQWAYAAASEQRNSASSSSQTQQQVPKRKKVRFSREVKEQSQINSVYDPFYANYFAAAAIQPLLNDRRPEPHHDPRLYLHAQQHGGHIFQQNFHGSPYHHQQYPTSHHFNPRYQVLDQAHGFHGVPNWNVHAPYYKPSFSYTVVYQEIFVDVPGPSTPPFQARGK